MRATSPKDMFQDHSVSWYAVYLSDLPTGGPSLFSRGRDVRKYIGENCGKYMEKRQDPANK